VPDHHYWTPSSSGTYSSKSAYDWFFMRDAQFEPAGRIWKSWAPPRCKFFLWLAFLNRCWTVDHLARKGLDHPQHSSFCDQEEETIQHILVGCVFSKEVWFRVLSMAGLQRCTPTSGAQNFQEWWQAAERMVPKQMRDGLNSLISLCCGICGSTAMLVSLTGFHPRCLGSSLTSIVKLLCGAWSASRA
jgi:hypothetical protein